MRGEGGEGNDGGAGREGGLDWRSRGRKMDKESAMSFGYGSPAHGPVGLH